MKPNRRTGSPGNSQAVEFFASTIRRFGFHLDTMPFDCLDYVAGKTWLEHDDRILDLQPSPYTLACDLRGDLAVVTSVDELAGTDCKGKILLMKGEICSEPLIPKNFPFYNPEHHQRIYALLEEKKPACIIAATERNPESVGALYPFPFIADGDFDIPVAYCTDTLGAQISALVGKPCHLVIDSRRIQSSAANVIARMNPEADQKIVVTAHIDAYEDTPGATDNASGTVVLLLLAEMLSGFSGKMGVEIAAFNGEDHYSAGGQKDYLARYGGELDQAALGINIDGVGFREGETAYSVYQVSPEVEEHALSRFQNFPGLVRGEPWYSGDHMIFLQAGIPCLAFTSEKALDLLRTVTHTRADTPEIVDPGKVVELASALNHLIRSKGGW